jgi:serine/threonine-protein kinase
LVVHRDINPANVLVDRQGNTVLLDFGIAKLLGDAETGRTLQAFTPEYAAPEQHQGGVITTATDVYGLGKLLARLLSGHKTDSELRSIIYVATHQDADQRYATAREMADDLQAWLEHRPLMARPDSLVYRTRKFTRRNWQWLSVAGLAVVVSIIGLLSTQKQAEMRRLEAERHRVVADFMLGLFQQADLMQSGSDLRVTDLLEQAARQARDELASEPEILVSLLSLIASGQTELIITRQARSCWSTQRVDCATRGVSQHRGRLLPATAKESHELED